MLFVGSFRHDPNRIALDWFVRESLPIILKSEPHARLVVAGSEPPPAHAYADYAANLDMLGYVEDIREPLAQYAVFICPILSGSGVRVKLLEAFAAGIPVVSTTVDAPEGPDQTRRSHLRAGRPDPKAQFAARVLAMWRDPDAATHMQPPAPAPK